MVNGVLLNSFTSGLVILAVTGTLFQGVNGIACLSCKRRLTDYESDLSECSHIEECEPDQVCFVEKFISETDPTRPKYRAGCRAVKDCKLISCSNGVTEKIPTHAPHVGKRAGDEIPLCSECCYSDMCNINGCNTTALEPERAKYHKRCFFCKNIIPQDASTCKDMEWCDQPSEMCSITADPVRRQYNLGCEGKSICDAALHAHENHGVPLQLKCFDGHLKNFNPVSNHTDTFVADVLKCPTALVPLKETTPATSTIRTTTEIKTTTPPTTIMPTLGPTTFTIFTQTTTTTHRPATPQATTQSTTTTLTTTQPPTTPLTATKTQTTTTPLPTTTKSPTKPLTKATQLTTTTTTSKPTNTPRTTQRATTPLATAIKPINTTNATTQQQTSAATKPNISTPSPPPPTITSTTPSTTTTPLRLSSTTSKPCSTNPCKHGGTCEDLPGTFNCYCTPGYVGKTCEEDKDECRYHGCQNGGLCTNTFGSFYCTCANGYTGSTCDVRSGCIDFPGFPCADMLKHGMCGDASIIRKCRNTCIRDLSGFPCGDMLKFGMCDNDDIKEKCKRTCGDCSSNSAIALVG